MYLRMYTADKHALQRLWQCRYALIPLQTILYTATWSSVVYNLESALPL